MKIFISFVIFTVFSQSNLFGAEISRLTLTNTSIETMMVDESEIIVTVNYPGEQISGICHIEIVSDSYRRDHKIEKLLNELEISPQFYTEQTIEVISSTIIRMNLAEGTYVDGHVLKTKSGLSFKKVIQMTLGQNRTVIVRPRSCQ